MKTFICILEPGAVEAVKIIFSTVTKHVMQLPVDFLFERVALKATENKLCELVCPFGFVFRGGKFRSGEILRCELGGFAV